MKRVSIAAFIFSGTFAIAQAPAVSMKQLMLDLIHPASNDLLLLINRGSPQDEREWAVVRRSALTLAESGNLLMTPGRARDQGDWMKDARSLADVGSAAYKAAQAKDGKALAALAAPLDASCTTCHQHYRPNVFPREGASR
jgi:hypothetical protein